MQLYTLFLRAGALRPDEARVAPHRLHVVAGDEARARRVAAEEGFVARMARTPHPANPWLDPDKSGCAAFGPSGSKGHPFAGKPRRVGPFGPLERHPPAASLPPEMRLLKLRSHAARIEERPVSDKELGEHAWDLTAPDGAWAVAWKQVPIFAAHFLPDTLELFRFPHDNAMFRLS